jgi:dTDP-4-amino-4,6-dideoxygalactose transaminase
MYRWGQEEIDAVAAVMRSGHWFRYGEAKDGHTQQAATLEREWAEFVGSAYACFTSSGTAALMCCYAGLGIGPGDEVIIPGYTWIASALAPLAVGAIPVLVDVDESLMLDPAAVERAITSRTKAITPVHMNGLSCDMERLSEIGQRRGVAIVEDACQCVGGVWRDGRRLGAIGDAGAYSFNFYKTISCGDGGMFVTNRRELYERGLIYHDGGAIFRPHAAEIGVEFFAGLNLRGNELLAAIMRVQLKRLDGIVTDLHRVRSAIMEQLSARSALRPIRCNGGRSTGTASTLGFAFADEAAARAFAAALAHRGVGCGLPIDSGRHVYSNWEPILARRGSHHPAGGAFQHPLNAGCIPVYDKEMLPRTLERLRSTVLIGMNPDWTGVQAEQVAAAIAAATIAGERAVTPEGKTIQ